MLKRETGWQMEGARSKGDAVLRVTDRLDSYQGSNRTRRGS